MLSEVHYKKNISTEYAKPLYFVTIRQNTQKCVYLSPVRTFAYSTRDATSLLVVKFTHL